MIRALNYKNCSCYFIYLPSLRITVTVRRYDTLGSHSRAASHHLLTYRWTTTDCNTWLKFSYSGCLQVPLQYPTNVPMRIPKGFVWEFPSPGSLPWGLQNSYRFITALRFPQVILHAPEFPHTNPQRSVHQSQWHCGHKWCPQPRYTSSHTKHSITETGQHSLVGWNVHLSSGPSSQSMEYKLPSLFQSIKYR